MLLEERHPECAAPGSGGLGTDDTTLNEVVEPSSFVAALACFFAPRFSTVLQKKFQCSGRGAITSGERHSIPEKGSWKT